MGALSDFDKHRLILNGFIPYEIRKLDEAKTPDGRPQDIDLKKPQWRSVIASRYKYVTELRKAGKTKGQIAWRIREYYKNPKYSVWDLIQADDTSPISKRKAQTDANILRRMTKRSRVTRQYGKAYIPRNLRKSQPRYLPNPPH